MTRKRKVLITAIAVASAVALYVSYDFLAARFWLGTLFNAPQEEFVCDGAVKILSEKEQKYREKRAKNLSRSLEDAIGLYARWGGHSWFDISLDKLRPEKLYWLQKLLTINDWEILSEMYMDKNYRDYYSTIPTLFAINGERAISILECEIKKTYLSDEEKRRFLNNLTAIKNLSVESRFISEYEYHNSYIEAILVIGFFSLILASILACILVPIYIVFAIIKYCITRNTRRQN